MEYPFDGFDWEFGILEAIRWCWRHSASLEFDYYPEDGDDCPVVTLSTPLRHPEGEVDRATARCATQTRVEEIVVDLVSRARERLNLE